MIAVASSVSRYSGSFWEPGSRAILFKEGRQPGICCSGATLVPTVSHRAQADFKSYNGMSSSCLDEQMNDSLPPYISYLLTALAAFAGGLGLGVTQRVSAGLLIITRKAFHLLLAGILWPFRWAVTAIKEWRRVSVYRHRRISWDDLPDESRLAVHVQDLSEEARASIGVKDLPLGEKRTILDKLILPNLCDTQHEGGLSLLDDRNSVTLTETAQVTVPPDSNYRDVRQDGMQLSLKVTFAIPEAGFHLPRGTRIGFATCRWRIAGSIRHHTRISSDTQAVEVWVMFLEFDSLVIYSHFD